MTDLPFLVPGQHPPMHNLKPVEFVPTQPLRAGWTLCDCGTSYRTDKCPTCHPRIRTAPRLHSRPATSQG